MEFVAAFARTELVTTISRRERYAALAALFCPIGAVFLNTLLRAILGYLYCGFKFLSALAGHRAGIEWQPMPTPSACYASLVLVVLATKKLLLANLARKQNLLGFVWNAVSPEFNLVLIAQSARTPSNAAVR